MEEKLLETEKKTKWTEAMPKWIFSKTKRKNLLLAIGFNLIFLILAIVVCDVKYEVSDDFVMASVLSGAYGNEYNPHMMFVNVIWGYLLMPFYKLVPIVSWYLVSLLGLCFCSFTAVTYMLLERLDRAVAMMLSMLFIAFFSNDAYILVQFTKVAALAVMSGSVVLLWGLFYGEGKRKIEVVVGGLLVIAGSMIRFKTIYMAGGFILIIVIFESIKMIKTARKNRSSQIIKSAVIGAALIGVVFGLRVVDGYSYSSDSSYKYYKQYSTARAGVIDWPDYGYEAIKDVCDEADISEHDYYMMRTWNFADNDVFNLEAMEDVGNALERLKKESGISKREIYDQIRDRSYSSYPSVWGCVLLLVISIIVIHRYWWMTIVSMLGAWAYLIYFYIQGRVVYRVECGIFICAFLTMLYFWDRQQCREIAEMRRVSFLLSIFFLINQSKVYIQDDAPQWMSGEEYKGYVEEVFYESWNYDSRRYASNIYKENAYSELNSEITENPENFYFMDFNTTIQTIYFQYNPFKTMPYGSYSNCVYMAGITSNFPEVNKILEDKEVENPLKCLVKDGVYLIDNRYQEEKLEYLREHYYPNARMELYKTVDGYQVWKYYEE